MKIKQYIASNEVIQNLIKTIKSIYIFKKQINLFVFLKVLNRQVFRDNLVEQARSIAFSFLLAMFPLIIFIFTLIPYFNIKNLKQNLLDSIHAFLPDSIFLLIQDTILEIINIQRGGLLSLGFVMTIYSATNGILAMINAFNRSYSLKERRTLIDKYKVSVIVIFVLVVISLVGVTTNLYFSSIISHVEVGKSFHAYALIIFKFLIIILVCHIGISFIYYIAPARHIHSRFFSVGSFVATFLILGFTLLFNYYVNNFNSYNKVYGSIGAFIGLMLWFYFISLMLLIGFEVNRTLNIAKRETKNLKNL